MVNLRETYGKLYITYYITYYLNNYMTIYRDVHLLKNVNALYIKEFYL